MCNKSKIIDSIEQERYMLSSNKKSDKLMWYQDTQIIDISDCELLDTDNTQVIDKIKAKQAKR
jgi:hypothetical protein